MDRTFMDRSFGCLTGPFIPAQKSSTKAWVIFLHGYGGSGQGVEPIAYGLDLPDCAFWFPNGPRSCRSYPSGYQWFDLQDICLQTITSCPQNLMERMDSVAYLVAQSLGEIKKQDHKAKLFLAGFSQGAALAYACGLMAYPVDGVLGFSGFYTLDRKPLYQPSLFWSHGRDDEVVPLDWMVQSVKILNKHGLNVASFHIFPHQGHSIGKEPLATARAFIKERF